MSDTKAISVLTADMKATTGKDGEYDITLSFPDVDRDDEVVDAKALQWRMSSRMPMDVDHGMTVVSTVGSGIPEYEGDELKLRDFRFAKTALAQDVKSLVDDGHISKVSVAFMDAEREKDEKDGKVHVRSAELLNAAIVAIPSLRDADMVRVAKSALQAKLGARNSRSDLERIQSTHDHMVELGAECAVKAAPADEEKGAKVLVGETGEEKSTTTDPEDSAAPAAEPLADVNVALAQASAAAAEVSLL